MYCPNCGSKNKAEIRFCTRCGTNLSVVSEALTEGFSGAPLDEDYVKLVKEYYEGRRNAMIGIFLLIGATKLLLILLIAGMAAAAAAVFTCWLFFWGFPQTAIGLSKLLNSRAEMRALGYDLPAAALIKKPPARPQLNRPAGEATTGPMVAPSITEHTTRHLDERKQKY